MLPEDVFAAFGIASDDGLGVGFGLGDEFAEFYIIEGAVAFAVVRQHDAGLGIAAAVVGGLNERPVGAPRETLGLHAAETVTDADPSSGKVGGLHPACEAVFGVRLQRHLDIQGGESRFRKVAGHGFGSAVGGVGHLPPGIGRDTERTAASDVVVSYPAFREAIRAGDFKAGIGQEVRAFFKRSLRLVPAPEHAGGFTQPLVFLYRSVHGEAFHEGLNLRRGGKLGQLDQRGQPGDGVRIAHHSRAEIELLSRFVRLESPHRVAAEAGVFGQERGIGGGLIESVETLQRPQGVKCSDGSIVGRGQLFQALNGSGVFAFHQQTLGKEPPFLNVAVQRSGKLGRVGTD